MKKTTRKSPSTRPEPLTVRAIHARNQLVLKWLGLVPYVINEKLRGNPILRRIGRDDARSIGYLALIDAAKPGRHDPARAKFNTLAILMIRQDIKHAFGGSLAMHVPEHGLTRHGSPASRAAGDRALHSRSLPDYETDLPSRNDPCALEEAEELARQRGLLALALPQLSDRERTLLTAWQNKLPLVEAGAQVGLTRRGAFYAQRLALKHLRALVETRE